MLGNDRVEKSHWSDEEKHSEVVSRHQAELREGSRRHGDKKWERSRVLKEEKDGVWRMGGCAKNKLFLLLLHMHWVLHSNASYHLKGENVIAVLKVYVCCPPTLLKYAANLCIFFF